MKNCRVFKRQVWIRVDDEIFDDISDTIERINANGSLPFKATIASVGRCLFRRALSVQKRSQVRRLIPELAKDRKIWKDRFEAQTIEVPSGRIQMENGDAIKVREALDILEGYGVPARDLIKGEESKERQMDLDW